MFTVIPSVVGGDALTSALWNGLADSVNKGVVRPIAEVTLGAATASISFTAIAADWSHLLVEVDARGDTAAVTTDLYVRLNGDTGANYDTQQFNANAGASNPAESLAQTVIRLGQIPAASAPANLFSHRDIVISSYASTTREKVVTMRGSLKYGTATGNMQMLAHSGFWRSAAAITSVTLLLAAGNFVAGTRATLYGMGGI